MPDNVERVRRWWDAYNSTGTVPIEIFDEAVEMSNPDSFPVTGPYVGREGIRRWSQDVWEVYEDLHHEVTDVVAGGQDETVVSVQRIQGRMRHTGLPIDAEWAGVWRFRDGSVFDVQGFLTPREARRACGLDP